MKNKTNTLTKFANYLHNRFRMKNPTSLFTKTLLKLFILVICLALNYISAEAQPPCENPLQFSNYRNTAPANGTTSTTLTANDGSNTVTFTNSSPGSFAAGRPIWSVSNSAVSMTKGGSGNGHTTTVTFANTSNKYVFRVSDMLNNSGTPAEKELITGYDAIGNTVMPVFFNSVNNAITDPVTPNLVYQSPALGSTQGAIDFYFPTAIKSFTVVEQGTINYVIITILGCPLDTDLGDAPSGYGTPKANTINGSTSPLKLGTTISTETSLTLNNAASGDGNTDDGVTSFPAIAGGNLSYTLPASYSVSVKATNNIGKSATLFAWIDWNGNGVFNTGEALSQSISSGTTNGTFTFTWPAGTTVTGTAGASGTYARFRITNDPAVSNSLPSADSFNGETEDYFIPFMRSLPLNLLSFEVEKNNSNAILNWITTEEVNTDYFVVEHSTNGSNYSEKAIVMTFNISNQTNNYSYKDAGIATGSNYYRLKMVDKDGSFRYSPVRLIYSGSTGKALLYPNPVSDIATITGLETGSEIRVLSADRLVVNKKIATASTVNIDMIRFSPGYYFIEVLTKGKIAEVIKLIKQK